MKNPTCSVSESGFVLLFLLAIPLVARAVDCQQYAWRAVQQTMEYNKHKCSGGHPAWWSEDINYHKNWCEQKVANPSGVGGPMPVAGTQMREDVLDKCRGYGGGFCDYYGDTAIKQNAEFTRLNCRSLLPQNIRGPNAWWNASHAYHANWCKGLGPGRPEPGEGIKQREGVLVKCRAAAGGAAGQKPSVMKGNFEITMFAHLGQAKLGTREGLGIHWNGKPAFPLTLRLVADRLQPFPPGWPATITYTIHGGSDSVVIPDAIRCDGPAAGPVTVRYNATLKDSRGYETSVQPASWTCVP